jgi:hypothetical protein
MRKIACGVSLLLTVILVAPPFAAGQKKAGKAKEETATTDDYKALEHLKNIEGELTYLEPSTKLMTVKVGYPTLVPNPQYQPGKNAAAQQRWVQHVNHLMQQQQQALTIRNAARRAQRLQQLAGQIQNEMVRAPAGPSPYRVVLAYKDFDVEAPDEVVVRRLTLPVEYDDKGNVKEYTEAEKKELRGKDPKVPGYAAQWDDVQVGQKVKLYLGKKKTKDAAKADDKEALKGEDNNALKPADKAKAADKAQEGDKKSKADDSTNEEPRAHAWMVLIQADPDPAATPKNSRKKKQGN